MVRIINCVYGRPAAGVPVRLERDIDGVWVEEEHGVTDDQGCIARLGDGRLPRGFYRLECNLDSYFFSMGITPFCPTISMQFRLADPSHSHDVSMLISPSSVFAYHLQEHEFGVA